MYLYDLGVMIWNIMFYSIYTHTPMYIISPAHIAASVGSVEGLQLLLQYNGDFNLQSNQGATPLHDAAAIGETGQLIHNVLTWKYMYYYYCMHV